ncbi:NADH-quinone oxidoreductase subunit C [Paenibacillus agilis]|uniref:NADH-quinone oxidoreductase subunit C n=1 Tax=Paenibacillus agilis TaxID=3020863 RepID=A0A559IPB7_9BACL|nr:NADH-quinone oxidoreductase subunit C [Paenibacillus agilis]TVX89492.1 NADH-quinone oxidoreductase subunit C [Paenibacillus agilis]
MSDKPEETPITHATESSEHAEQVEQDNDYVTERTEQVEDTPQARLDRLVEQLKHDIAEGAVEEAVINEVNGHLPTITVKKGHWLAAAHWLQVNKDWSCDYLRNLAGVDLGDELEVVYHLISLQTRREIAVHVKTEREQPSIPSVTPLWPTANWNEREVYDLLGIDFPGHPDLRRIMMPDDWVGHPLRKDYDPSDSEV